MAAAAPAAAAPAYNKCIVNGSTTYQREPCPFGEARKDPTVEQLNAERKKRLLQAGNFPAIQSVPAPSSQASASLGAAAAPKSGKEQPTSAVRPPVEPTQSFRCDGRTSCTQMSSCAEAKYFLSHCPGIKMDGDGDGIPCELQWCN
ncbi:excalibur calcium-binding domain-containing protein [Roseateles sp.]|uniref:excalibur calcium-binding domain-containing protein n=1 Tax=Roseateles sp. TaxID=1971397 RepID=UPI00286A1C81|nr:excalibur calcium-binding domain-containing protein [Roseateles sp.]